MRQRLLPIAERYGARIKVAEVPPGPPVLQTLVAEVYGPAHDERIAIARRIRDLWKRTDGVVDVDWYVEDDQPKYRLLVDKEKAALNGISEDDIARTMHAGLCRVSGRTAARRLREGRRPADASASTAPAAPTWTSIQNLKVAGRTGRLVALSELVTQRRTVVDGQEHLSQEPACR